MSDAAKAIIILFIVAWNVIILIGTAYIVFWLGFSGWWWVLAVVLMSGSASSSK